LVVTSKRFNGISKKFLCDATGLTFERWAASDGTIYLVRPDHHIAARWKATPTISELKKAYRELAKKHHPDKVQNLGEVYVKAAKEKFSKIQAAYENIKKQRGI